VVKILEDAIKGEQCAISVYSQIAEMTRGKDIVTYDIVSQILADEVEHEEALQALHDDITEFVEELKGTLS
jgi:bacterioferritin